MEFEPLQKGDRVHHDDAGHGVVKTVLGAELYSITWHNLPHLFSVHHRRDLLKMPRKLPRPERIPDHWEEVLSKWRQTRRRLEAVMEETPGGANGDHLAKLRMQEIRAWKQVEAVAATDVRQPPER
jgi:hypothetical protein